MVNSNVRVGERMEDMLFGGDIKVGGCEAVHYRIIVSRSMLLHSILLKFATKHGLPNGLVQYKRLSTQFDIT